MNRGVFMNTEISDNNVKLLSALSYFGPLFIIGMVSVEKDNEDVRYHTRQGAVMFILFTLLYLVLWLLLSLCSSIEILSFIISVFLAVPIGACHLILLIMGVASAIKIEQSSLPIIGRIAFKLKRK